MPATIEVNKQSVKDLLSSGREHKFLIPEYQRPYAWGYDQIETLFEDLWDFATSDTGGFDNKGTYFLGSIVSFENENGEQEIIDGQQRITSLFLLLRAIYTYLQNMKEKPKAAFNFINQIEPAIWETDKETGDVFYSKILIKSLVMSDEGNEELRKILETGIANPDAKDNYSKNYNRFLVLLKNKAQENPLQIYSFFYAILNQAILFPIKAYSQDDALKIFSTLNDRGLPLSDSDIFKATIYNSLNSEQKKFFINKWKELEESAEYIGESTQQLFYYYMFFLRAKNKDIKTTTPGLRKYFTENKDKLLDLSLLDNLVLILDLFKVINIHDSIDEDWSKDVNVRKSLDILSSYPNEFWKYPVVIYYISHHKLDNFCVLFNSFLNKLIVELLSKYLVTPTINAVKGDILKLDSFIIDSSLPIFDFKPVDQEALKNTIKTPHKSVTRMLLKILAYQKQDSLLPDKWEIEHIFPQKWQPTYFSNHSTDEINEKIEHLGNKVPFEKKLNIIASNGYFDKKKEEYAKSSIQIVKGLIAYGHEWNLDSIAERDVRVTDAIMGLFLKWNNEYKINNSDLLENSLPSEEDLARIEEYKKRGWIKE